jgi:hypothetical protein
MKRFMSWWREIFCWQFILEWINYTPFFFTHAPPRKWHTYFASHWRVATSLVYYKNEMAKCDQTSVWEQNARRRELLDAAKSSYHEHRSKSLRKIQRAIGL